MNTCLQTRALPSNQWLCRLPCDSKVSAMSLNVPCETASCLALFTILAQNGRQSLHLRFPRSDCSPTSLILWYYVRMNDPNMSVYVHYMTSHYSAEQSKLYGLLRQATPITHFPSEMSSLKSFRVCYVARPELRDSVMYKLNGVDFHEGDYMLFATMYGIIHPPWSMRSGQTEL